jgi:serine/threonine protein kinase
LGVIAWSAKLAAGGFGVVYLARGQRRPAGRRQGIPAVVAGHPRSRRAAAAGAPEKLSLYRLGLKSFFEEGRSLAQISHAFRGERAELLPRERDRLHGHELPGGRNPAGLHHHRARAEKAEGLPRIHHPLLFDEILRGLRIVHQHKMLHLDIKPANIFITDDNKAVMIDFGAAREVLSKEGNFIRPMYTPGFAAPEMYRRDSSMGPWTDIYAIGACIYACMQGYPPNDAPQRLEKDRLALALSRLRGVYSDNLIEVVEWCMSLDPLSRPQSVFALQKELSREGERRYTKLSVGEKMRLQFDTMVSDTKKNVKRQRALAPS